MVSKLARDPPHIPNTIQQVIAHENEKRTHLSDLNGPPSNMWAVMPKTTNVSTWWVDIIVPIGASLPKTNYRMFHWRYTETYDAARWMM